MYLDPENVTERRVIIVFKLGVTSNPKCTQEETVGAVWNSGAITKGGSHHINDIEREAIRAQVLWRKVQLDIVMRGKGGKND